MKKRDLKMWKVILLRELKDLACRVYNNIITQWIPLNLDRFLQPKKS